ncbi:POT family proton-dependent oligopeptide transporter [Sphingomonas kyeonggiensis]|uniref:POT family proton-dependent oligopeptide transporter n=1 Tax=Sphingomonas kyeonggiensis TaxID=1268553 RepID=A0A7W7NQ03_9SPHN|nr:peptide MFS transporter [Sphingomonas kyeonggiensis]MBB4837393.1 POT family proton-dependent oligopeptide transporter [Sphingomonas kyeonggiensis]
MVDTPTADSPAEPDITHVNPAKEATWFGHPRQLARLFTTEMWERFGYYGMRALLTLYLTQHFMFGDREATGIYGGFTALVYLTPLVGGYLADQYLGSKRAVKFGAIIMSLGYAILCFGGPTATPYATIDGQRYEVSIEKQADKEVRYVVDGSKKLEIKGNDDGSVDLLNAGAVERKVEKGKFESNADRSPLYVMVLLIALSMVSVGNGFFKPNISTMVGELYEQGDRRRDSGFTIFYMGINTGSLFSQILCPWLAVAYGWSWGFGLAAIGMMISWALIQFNGGKLNGYGEPPAGPKVNSQQWIIYAAALCVVPLFYLLYVNLMHSAAPAEGSGFLGYVASLPLMGKLLFGSFLLGVPAILIWSFVAGSRTEFQMMLAAMVLIVFNVVFWTLFEQAGSSLTLFADRNTDLSVFGLFTITAGQTQFFNAAFIVLLAPFMSIMWGALAKRGLEPSIPVKFGIALIGVAAGFLLLVWGAAYADAGFKVSIWWLAGLYFIHSAAELCISPVGLSMITKLSIARIVGLMMGVWFLSISVAQYVAGVIAQFASVDTVGGQVTNLKVSLDVYVKVFTTISIAAIILGVLLLLLSWPLKYWMHGVK